MNVSSVITKDQSGFIAASRVNRSLTATLEKKALQWMAERAPKWISSDQLTLLGLTAQLGAGACYAWSRFNRFALLGVIICLALNWLGDSLDGTLARVRQQQRPRYGFYVDHMADIFGSVALMCGRDVSGIPCVIERELSSHLHSNLLSTLARLLWSYRDSHLSDHRQPCAAAQSVRDALRI